MLRKKWSICSAFSPTGPTPAVCLKSGLWTPLSLSLTRWLQYLLITQKINELVHVTMSTQDYPTFNFLQWYVAEQHEEEKLFKSILDKLVRAGDTGEGLYLIDKK